MKNLIPRIEILPETKLIGKSLRMSLAKNCTYELWHSFMPLRKQIKHQLNADLYSIQIYDPSLDFNHFTPDTEFEKRAAIAVSRFEDVPEGMETYTIQGGLYAVFTYQGTSGEFQDTFHYIFNIWLKESEYKLDQREHFEILGDKYKNNDPDSEEEIWIPIKEKYKSCNNI